MATSCESLQRGADLSGVAFVMISACPGSACAVVVVSARELDLLTCPMLRCRLTELLGCGAYRVLVVDLTGVVFFGAAGLGVLVEVGNRARLRGVELRLVVSSRPGWRALRLSGLVGVFAIYENLAQALTGESLGVQAGRGSCR